MTRSGATLDLLVPGLLGPVKGAEELTPPLSVPLLERCLARARLEPAPGVDLESTLCPLFGITADPGTLPIAALRRLGRGLPADQRYWLQVEPVCLRPDQSRLLLFDTLDFEVSGEELKALGSLFQHHFSDLGWLIEVDAPHCWFISPQDPPELQTFPLGEVYGRNMDLFLPRGRDALIWHGLLNEMQMLFFDADINREREAQGKMTVNGLWLSGGGFLPTPVLDRHFEGVYGGGDLLRGLSVLSNLEISGSPAQIKFSDLYGDTLIVNTLLQRPVWQGDPFRWRDALLLFEDWLSLILKTVKTGGISELRLYSCDGRRFVIRGGDRFQLWKRPRSLIEWFPSS